MWRRCDRLLLNESIALRAQIEPNHFLKAPRRWAFKKWFVLISMRKVISAPNRYTGGCWVAKEISKK